MEAEVNIPQKEKNSLLRSSKRLIVRRCETVEVVSIILDGQI
jgi:hypothetical protein